MPSYLAGYRPGNEYCSGSVAWGDIGLGTSLVLCLHTWRDIGLGTSTVVAV